MTPCAKKKDSNLNKWHAEERFAKRSFAISFQITLLWTRAREPGPVSPVKVDSPLPFPWTQRGEIYTPLVSLPFLVSDVRHIALGVGKRYGSFPFLRNQHWFCARMMPLASSKAIPRRKPPTGDFSQGDRGAVHVCRPRKLPESEIEGNTITYRNAF